MQTKKIIDHIHDAVYTRKSNLPFTVIATAMFGSYAADRQNIHSNIDLLVVAEGIHPQLHRRASQIVLLKNMLSIGMPSDIILQTINYKSWLTDGDSLYSIVAQPSCHQSAIKIFPEQCLSIKIKNCYSSCL